VADRTVDFQRERSKALKKKIFRKLRIPGAILIILLILALIYTLMGEVRRSNIADSFRAIPKTVGESRGFPYNEDELSLDRVILIGDKPLIVSDSGVEVISNNADKLFDRHLDWGDTRVNSFNGRALVYSNTSAKAYLIGRTAELASFEEESPIVTGAVGKNGSVAVSYSTDGSQSVVKVYKPSKKLYWQWQCDREYVSSLSLSPSGGKILISAIGVDNAEIYSRIILFDTRKTAPQFDTKIEGTSILKVIYASSGRMIAVGDNKTVVLSRKGEIKSQIKYADDALFTVDSDNDGNVLLCYKEFGGSKIKVVRIPAGPGKNKEFEIGYMPESADIRGGRIAFASGNTVEIYNTGGKVLQTYDCKQDVKTVLLSNSGIFTLENGSVCKY
jgi:WD40 repeat protein